MPSLREAGWPRTAPDPRSRKRLTDCDRKLKQYRAALDARADPVEVTQWINETKAQRARTEAELRAAPRADSISREEITNMLEPAADVAQKVTKADPADKAGLYQQLGLRMTYYPEKQQWRRG